MLAPDDSLVDRQFGARIQLNEFMLHAIRKTQNVNYVSYGIQVIR